jgi:hypothetical protein
MKNTCFFSWWYLGLKSTNYQALLWRLIVDLINPRYLQSFVCWVFTKLNIENTEVWQSTQANLSVVDRFYFIENILRCKYLLCLTIGNYSFRASNKHLKGLKIFPQCKHF